MLCRGLWEKEKRSGKGSRSMIQGMEEKMLTQDDAMAANNTTTDGWQTGQLVRD